MIRRRLAALGGRTRRVQRSEIRYKFLTRAIEPAYEEKASSSSTLPPGWPGRLVTYCRPAPPARVAPRLSLRLLGRTS
jgi:hypothetical protein